MDVDTFDSGPSVAAKTVSQMLGEIVWLMTQSPPHKQMFIGDLEWFCMPAILLEQYRIFYGPNSPAAVAFWASVSEETDARLAAGGGKLRADEWLGGDSLWLMELVAPFGGHDEILKDLSVNLFGGRPFKFHAVGSDGQRRIQIYMDTPIDEHGPIS
ncbi:MAG: toxin-activating lysine-acyltransferase [Phenylobacterium sp.]